MSDRSLPDIELDATEAQRGNIRPLLHEIRHALQLWLNTGRETVIDLSRIPLAPGEERHLMDVLGHGEVQAHLSALGASEFRESDYPGVWLVTHYNADEQIIGRYVEITDAPALLKSQPQDIEDAFGRLSKVLGKNLDIPEAEIEP